MSTSGQERLESAALLLLSLSNTDDVDIRKPLRYCRWTAAEDRLLAQLVRKKYGTWKTIAARIPGRTVRQTRSRWLKLTKKYKLAQAGKQGQNTKKILSLFSPEEEEEEEEQAGKDNNPPPKEQLPPLRHEEDTQSQLPALMPYLITEAHPNKDVIIRRIIPRSYKFTVEPEQNRVRYHEPQRVIVSRREPGTKGNPPEDVFKVMYAPKEPIHIPVAGDRTIKAYRCLFPACNRIFQSQSTLNEHVISHQQQFQCKECSKKFTRQEPLDVHLIDHHMERRKKNKFYC